MNKSNEINEIAKALCKVQFILTGAKKDSTNPFFKSNYADLESVWDSIRKPLTENGLSVSQMPCVLDNGMPGLETILMHESGQFISNVVPIVSTKQDPQAYGSAITYFRRYALSAIVGQIQVDDDGNHATHAEPSVNAPESNQMPDRYEGVTGKEKSNVSDQQLKRLYAILRKSGKSHEEAKEVVDSSKKLNQKQYDELCKRIQPN